MSGAEVATRVRQAASKRWDEALFRLGLPSFRPSVGTGSQTRGRFFWAEGGEAERAELIRTMLPDETEAALREADRICNHRFSLLGYEELDFGAEIDWHLDPVHGRRAPQKPWSKIAYLDFVEVGDHKIVWELNRHQHLVTLAKARVFTGDRRYLDELIRQWRSWQSANRYPIGINWASSLEVAFRALSWIWIEHLLPDEAANAEFHRELVGGLEFHGRYIERFLSTYFSPNTHLLGEALALFFLGTLYPGMARATRWRNEGWGILTEQAKHQVRADGVYFEQSLHYHVYALDFFLHARWLAQLNEMAIPGEFDTTLQKMLDVVEALAQAGPAEGFGDDDGGRLFNPQRNQTHHMTDPLGVGALLYERKDAPGAGLTEESIWLFGDRAVTRLSQASGRDSVVARAFDQGGLYIMGGSSPCSHQLVVDAGPQGTGRSGHGHADALSIRLTADGRRWLVDSGSGIYVGAERSLRDFFRGTGAHNTLRVNGEDQAVPGDAFSWTQIPETKVERWVAGSGFSYLVASHDGYRRLSEPVTHQRSVFSVGDGLYLLRDAVVGSGRHSVEVHWHFAPGTQVEAMNEGILATAESAQSCVQLRFAHDGAWSHDIVEGQHSPAYGRIVAVNAARSYAMVDVPAEIGSLLTVGIGKQTEARLITLAEGAVRRYELRSDASTHLFFFSSGSGRWRCGDWSSDAEVIYCEIPSGELGHLIVIGGSSIAHQERAILNVDERLEWVEWRKRDGVVSETASRLPMPVLRTDHAFGQTLLPTRP